MRYFVYFIYSPKPCSSDAFFYFFKNLLFRVGKIILKKKLNISEQNYFITYLSKSYYFRIGLFFKLT